jgi:HPt (histidine-containing phosphotransfer) domain-containing protein
MPEFADLVGKAGVELAQTVKAAENHTYSRDSEAVSTQAVLHKLSQIFGHRFNDLDGMFHSLEAYVETVESKLKENDLVIRSQSMEGALRLHSQHDNASVASLVASAEAIEKYLRNE